MPKKRKSTLNVNKRKWRKFTPFTVLVSAIILGAILLPVNLLNQSSKKTPPKIDSISPSTGHLGEEITLTGSGFTTQEEYEGPKGRRAGGQIAYFPGTTFFR